MLGLLLFALALGTDQLTMAAPASRGVIIGIAILLLLVALVLAALARRPQDRVLAIVALANASSAIVIAFWLAAGWASFSALARVVVAATIAGLLLVALAELLATMSPGGRTTRART